MSQDTRFKPGQSGNAKGRPPGSGYRHITCHKVHRCRATEWKPGESLGVHKPLTLAFFIKEKRTGKVDSLGKMDHIMKEISLMDISTVWVGTISLI